MTSNSVQPADEEMHGILNLAYTDACELVESNKAALDAIIAALLEQPGAATTSSAAPSEPAASQQAGAGADTAAPEPESAGPIDGSSEAEAGTAAEFENADLGGGTVSGDEVRKIVKELGNEEWVAWRDQERRDFM